MNLSLGLLYKLRAKGVFLFLSLSFNTLFGQDLILNGGFENGSSPWFMTTSSILTSGSSQSYRGNYHARLGDIDNARHHLTQTLTIPSGTTSATLSFYLKITTSESAGSRRYDSLQVRIRDTGGITIVTLATYGNNNANNTYQLYSLPIPTNSNTVGTSRQINFYCETDGSLPTTFRIDDVSLTYSAPTITPSLTGYVIDKPSVLVNEPFVITVSGKNAGNGQAAYGGIAVQIREAFTKDVEVSESHTASGATSGQSVWWQGERLGTGHTAQYLHVEPTWLSWASNSTKTSVVTITPRKAGTYRVYTKMYLSDGTNFPRDPSGTTSNTDHQNESTVFVGSVTVTAPTITPSLTGYVIDKPSVLVNEPFVITVSGKNAGNGQAAYGGIAVQIREAFTKDVEVSESHTASGATSGQSVWWKGERLGTGHTAQYLHVEPTWLNWSSTSTKTSVVTITPRKAGTYRVYTKMYLSDGAANFPRDPSGTTSNTDHQNESTVFVGTVTVNAPTITPSLTGYVIDKPSVLVNEPFVITVSGKNAGNGQAAYGGIAVQIREAFTKDVEVSESHTASGATSGQSVWWKGELLGNGYTAQYLHVEPTWLNWSSTSTKTSVVTITPRKAGTYRVYTKMYLSDGAGNFPRDPSGTTSNTDHQNESTVFVGTVTVASTTPIISNNGERQPGNGTISLNVTVSDPQNLALKSVKVHYLAQNNFPEWSEVQVDMRLSQPGVYETVIPLGGWLWFNRSFFNNGEEIRYWFTAENDRGQIGRLPLSSSNPDYFRTFAVNGSMTDAFVVIDPGKNIVKGEVVPTKLGGGKIQNTITVTNKNSLFWGGTIKFNGRGLPLSELSNFSTSEPLAEGSSLALGQQSRNNVFLGGNRLNLNLLELNLGFSNEYLKFDLLANEGGSETVEVEFNRNHFAALISDAAQIFMEALEAILARIAELQYDSLKASGKLQSSISKDEFVRQQIASETFKKFTKVFIKVLMKRVYTELTNPSSSYYSRLVGLFGNGETLKAGFGEVAALTAELVVSNLADSNFYNELAEEAVREGIESGVVYDLIAKLAKAALLVTKVDAALKAFALGYNIAWKIYDFSTLPTTDKIVLRNQRFVEVQLVSINPKQRSLSNYPKPMQPIAETWLTAQNGSANAEIVFKVTNKSQVALSNVWIGADIHAPETIASDSITILDGPKVENTYTPISDESPPAGTGLRGLLKFSAYRNGVRVSETYRDPQTGEVYGQGVYISPGESIEFRANYDFVRSVTGHSYLPGRYSFRTVVWADGYPGAQGAIRLTSLEKHDLMIYDNLPPEAPYQNHPTIRKPFALHSVTDGEVVMLSWSGVKRERNGDAIFYRIARSTSPSLGFSDVNWAQIDRYYYMDGRGLVRGTRYYYKITAIDNSGLESVPDTTEVLFIVRLPFTLTVNSNPAEGGTTSPIGTNTYEAGRSVQVAATPNLGWEFNGWSGDTTAPKTSNPLNVVMWKSKTITANFQRISGTLLSLDTAYVSSSGQTVAVAIKAWGFNNVGSFSLVISYNPSILTFQGVANAPNGTLPNTSGSNISISWFSTTGISIGDGGKLMDLQFTYLGGLTSGQSTPLTFVTSACEISNTQGTRFNNVTYQNGAVKLTSGVIVSGTVYYQNTAQNPISNVTVTLTPSSGSPRTSQSSQITGTYSFSEVASGSHTLSGSKTGNWGGVNSTDALLVARHFVELERITDPLKLLAADVNASGTVNATDALLIQQRSIGMISSFPAGDWKFASHSITVASSDVTQNITGLCVGDVNGSYTPGSGGVFAKGVIEPYGVIGLSVVGTESVRLSESFDVVVRAGSEMALGAASLVFRYPRELAVFEGVSSSLAGLMAHEADGVISIGWFSADGKAREVGEHKALVSLKFKGTGREGIFETSLDPTGELVDGQGLRIRRATLRVTSALLIEAPRVFSLEQNYPNPFNPTTQIRYQLPRPGKVKLSVFNLLGQEVARLADGDQDAASHAVIWDAAGMPSGTYIYRIQVQTGTGFFEASKLLTIIK